MTARPLQATASTVRRDEQAERTREMHSSRHGLTWFHAWRQRRTSTTSWSTTSTRGDDLDRGHASRDDVLLRLSREPEANSLTHTKRVTAQQHRTQQHAPRRKLRH